MRKHTSILFLSLVLTACSGDEKAAKENLKASESEKSDILLKLAHASENAGDLAAAEHYYKDAVQKDGEVKFRLELADFYRHHHTGQSNRFAMDVLNQAAKIYSEDTDVLRDIANVYVDMNKPEEAVETIDKALAINTSDAFLYNTKGVALDRLGKYTQARNAYSTAIELDPSDANTFSANLGMSYITTEYYSKAINLLLPLAEAPDATPQIRQNLALAYGLKGDNDNALLWAKKDLGEKQAEENVKFYNMLAKKGGIKAAPGGSFSAPVSDKVDSIPPIP